MEKRRIITALIKEIGSAMEEMSSHTEDLINVAKDLTVEVNRYKL
ncbi:hypothetical protein [Paraliobacillus sediminis]|nr:hypothetical protein [Paraliobacillus sediminis]